MKIIVDMRWVYPDNGEDIRVLEVRYGWFVDGKLTDISEWDEPVFVCIPSGTFKYFDQRGATNGLCIP